MRIRAHSVTMRTYGCNMDRRRTYLCNAHPVPRKSLCTEKRITAVCTAVAGKNKEQTKEGASVNTEATQNT